MSSDLPHAAEERHLGNGVRWTGLQRWFVNRLLKTMRAGSITVTFPSGERADYRGQLPGPRAHFMIKRWSLLRRLVASGHLGFSEAYLAGDFETPDLTQLLHWAMANEASVNRVWDGTILARAVAWAGHFGRRNTRAGSQRNISAHYDLGNAFYRAWLDAGMNYSSALYTDRTQSLEDAQASKNDRIVSLLAPTQGDRVLEIGCGWGALAERLIGVRGCHLTGLTLSHEQLAFARGRLSHERADIRLQDYRDVSGQFDRIASIEMIEAVGESYWPTYFDTIRRCLKPGGTAVLQVITIDEAHYASYRRSPDFIQQYIFPGGMLPTKTVMREQINRAALTLRHAEHFGASYARTISAWRERFRSSWPDLRRLGFDEAFRRKWEYYFAYCETGFDTGLIDVGLYQIGHSAPATQAQ